MNWLKKYEAFNESNDNFKYNSKDLIYELCVSMILLNPEFLDNILDRNLSARYTENDTVLLTDLKNLILSKNRLVLGQFVDNKCIVDNEISKLNIVFRNVNFSIEKDWNTLVNARIMARNIFDKLLVNQKLDTSSIRKLYWIGPNKNKEYTEDIVIELSDGKQYSIVLNKNLNSSKTASFNKFGDEIIGDEMDLLFKDKNLEKWNKLTQTWIKIIYENSNDLVKSYISKFMSIDKLEKITYFNFFNIRHSDPSYQHLGEYFKELDKNILYLSDLLNEIWKKKDMFLNNFDEVYNRWKEDKIILLNSKILEYIFTNSLVKNHKSDIKKLNDGFKTTSGIFKKKLLKIIVEKIGSVERTLYYFGNNGNNLNILPNRQYFRDNFNNFNIKFDYHVKVIVDNNEDSNNDFIFKIILDVNNDNLLNLDINVKFSSGEFNNKLSSKYNFTLSRNFNNFLNNTIEY